MSNIAWACAALRFYDEPLLRHVDGLAESMAPRMSPLALSSLLVSFAKLGAPWESPSARQPPTNAACHQQLSPGDRAVPD